jgi:Na+/proline symporter
MIIATIATCALFALIGVLHARRLEHGADAYLTARNSIGTGLSIATLVATACGVWILSGPTQMGLYFGMAALVGYAVGQAAPFVLFPIVGPRLRQLMPLGMGLSEFGLRRFGRPVQLLVSAVTLFYMGTYLAAELTAIAQAVHALAGLSLLFVAALVGAATAVYAAWGGIRTAIWNDRIQFWLILALLAAVTAGVLGAVGSPSAIVASLQAARPETLAWRADGWINAVVLILGIITSNLFDNSYWQRIFACRDARTVVRSFGVSSALILPILLLAGLLGLAAVGRVTDDATLASSAVFALVSAWCPVWVSLGVLVLALVLSMSTLAALFNGLVGLLAADWQSLEGRVADTRLLRLCRWLTVAFLVPAVLVAARGYDVTYLFLVADLVCAGAVVPIFAGLWSKHLTAPWAVAAALLGIGIGATQFPGDLLADGLLRSFVAAMAVSSLATATGAWVGRLRSVSGFDFGRLESRA